MTYPVTKNGVYKNPKDGSLEYHFVFGGKTAKVGACRADISIAMKKQWEQECIRQIQQLLVDKFGAKPIILNSRGKPSNN